ncbi:GGDEF domain-containing protein [Lactiplantibacillus daowaiensis]|uniref:GGDEF domain-containing protein n=1 Tax=Lactiplantibacillus daowaiensis TaxID=2559918 RepID=A0ABW1S3X3_9LACO|nr:GGDEF domain-containing protein [Lactiplantibacillus daowaiensis]
MTWFSWQVPPFVTGVFFILGVITLYWASVNTLRIWSHERHWSISDANLEAWYGLAHMVVFVFSLQEIVVGATYSWEFMNFQLIALIFCGYFLNIRVPYYFLCPLLLAFMLFNRSLMSWESWAHAVTLVTMFVTLSVLYTKFHQYRGVFGLYLLVTIPLGGLLWFWMKLKYQFSWMTFRLEWLYYIVFVILLYLYVTMLSHDSELRQQLEWSANHDSLTTTQNFAAFTESLTYYVNKGRHHHQPLTMMMFDIDHFKQMNDTYGHSAGDQVLKQVVDVAQTVLDVNDSHVKLYRTGGEEFNVLFPNYDLATARPIVDQIFNAINHTPIRFGQQQLALSISVGVTAWSANDATARAFYERVDQHLYYSKQHGRMQITSD